MSRPGPPRRQHAPRPHRPGRYGVHKAKMRGRTVAMIVMGAAALALLWVFVAMLTREP